MAHTAPHPKHLTASGYVLVWVGLAILTFATFGFGHIPLGAWNVVIALVIAGTKAVLVVLFFMHLREQRGTSRLVIATTVVFIAVLILFTMSDVAFRFPITNPPNSESAAPFTNRPLEPMSQPPPPIPANQPGGR